MGTTKQKQKTVTKAVTTRTAVTPKQSLEIVQTLLHSALSSIAYLRDLLPEKAFHKQLIGINDKLVYSDYAHGRLNKKKPTTEHTCIRAMRRGTSKRVDMLLNWLETGAFTALKDGRLKAIQCRVHAQPDSREKVVETYTFNIKYDLSGGCGKQLVGVQMDSQQGGERTVEATNLGLQLLLRETINCCGSLPDLPVIRFVSMSLFYDGEDFKPPGFVPGSTDSLMFANALGWTKQSKKLTELPSCFHATTLTITHLHQLPPSDDAGPLQEQHSPRIPSQLEYGDISSRLEDIGCDQYASNENGKNAVDTSNIDHVTPSTVVDEEAPPVNVNMALTQQVETPAETSQPVADQNRYDLGRRSSRTFSESLDTQSSNVPRMKSAVQDMLQPERLTQGDTQTQAPLRARTFVNPGTITPGPPTFLARQAADSAIPAVSKLTLRPEVAARLTAEKATLYEKATQLVAPKQRRVEGQDVVMCQCGYDGEDNAMINCSFCDTWQHLNCYGYSGAGDPRVPHSKDDHACYQCLFGGRDAVKLSRLQDLALKRRVMSSALQNSFRKKTEIGKSLNMQPDVAARLQRELLEEGFIMATSKSHKPGFAKKGQPYFVPVAQGPVHQAMIEQLFDPLVMIEENYASNINIATPRAVAKQIQQMRSASMPPPATPASRLRVQGTPTTASGLDPRASMPPYITPSHVPGRITKRPRDEEDIFSTPAKRAATSTPLFGRLKCVQSQSMLKAYGESSSPVVRQ